MERDTHVVISPEAQRQVRDEILGEALLRLAVAKAALLKALWAETLRLASLPKDN